MNEEYPTRSRKYKLTLFFSDHKGLPYKGTYSIRAYDMKEALAEAKKRRFTLALDTDTPFTTTPMGSECQIFIDPDDGNG
jgi:hypothetical protein